jgi:hypothetical protein
MTPRDPFSVHVTKTGKIIKPRLEQGPLLNIGNIAVAEQKKRWAAAIDAEGNAAKQLSMKYLFEKKAFTGVNRPKRDMKMTGVTVDNFTLRRAINNQIRAENTSRAARSHANRAQTYEQMIGLAGSDQIAIFKATQAEYGAYLKRAWVPIG